MIVGYARVSTKGQAKDGNSLEYQEQELKKAGADKIYQESYTGTKVDRPILNELIAQLDEGDTVIVTKLDRIARNAKGGLEIIDQILNKGCAIRILNMGMFDSSPTGKLMRTVMLGFAEFERDMIVQRTQEGKTIAKQNKNFKDGRPFVYSKEQKQHAYELLKIGKTYHDVEQLTGISKSTLIRYRNRIGE